MTDGDRGAPRLVLGPLLRYVGETEATIWVETDRACRVEILGHQARDLRGGRAPLRAGGDRRARAGAEYEYQVTLDGTVRWPEPDTPFPPSVLRTLDPGGRCGWCSVPAGSPSCPSCGRRRQAPARAAPRAGRAGRLALDLRGTPRERWPDLMLLIGDQVYADETGPATRQFISERRDPSQPPGSEVADFTEYCFLYREAWSEPLGALAAVGRPVRDDLRRSRRPRRLEHLGRVAPRLRGQAVVAGPDRRRLHELLALPAPGQPVARRTWPRTSCGVRCASAVTRRPCCGDFAGRADERAGGIQWSYRRSVRRGPGRRDRLAQRRVLGRRPRLMVGEAEWQWVTESVAGDWDHVVLATSLPLLLPAGIHAVEAWNEAVCGGAWGRLAARAGERVRRAVDLEHWAAFGTSFTEFERLLTGLATGEEGRPPASVTVLGGDIHHSYLAAVEFPPGTGPRCPVYQAVCSPDPQRAAGQLPAGPAAAQVTGGRSGRGSPWPGWPGCAGRGSGWRTTHGPWFHNMLSRARIRADAGRGSASTARSATRTASRTSSACAKPTSAERQDGASGGGKPKSIGVVM